MSNPAPKIESLIVNLQANLTRFRNMPGTGTADDTRKVLQFLAAEVLALQPHHKNLAIVTSVQEVALTLWLAGFHHLPSPAQDIALAEASLGQGWQGLIAATLLAPAWEVNARANLDTLPTWLWKHYASWLLRNPQGSAAPGSADRFARDMETLLRKAAQWTEQNTGSTAVRQLLSEITVYPPLPGLLCSEESLSSSNRAFGSICTRLVYDAAIDPYVPPFRDEPRARLRVAWVLGGVGPGTAYRTAMRFLELLDPERFERAVFTRQIASADLETELLHAGIPVTVLDLEAAKAISTLREGDFDVVVYGYDLTGDPRFWSIFSAHRIAPLGLAMTDWPCSVGRPAINLRIVGQNSDEPSAERLGVLSVSSAFLDRSAVPEADEEAKALMRTSLGIPDDAKVFVTASDVHHASPDTFAAWADILEKMPDAYLVWTLPTYANRALAKYFVTLLCLGRNLKPAHIAVHFDDRPNALTLGQVYLDNIGYSLPDKVSAAILGGLPVVSLTGKTIRGRAGADLLNAAGLTEGVVQSRAEYVSRAVALMGDAEAREKLRAKTLEAEAMNPSLTDPLAASDAFAGLVEYALAQHAERDDKIFAPAQAPLRLPALSRPADAILTECITQVDTGDAAGALLRISEVLARQPSMYVARYLHGRALGALGRLDRAVHYLVAALQGHEESADLWWELAMIFRQSGAALQAIQALEGCLRQDASRVEAWELLHTLASEAGHTELAEQTASALKALRAPAEIAS